LEIEVRRLGEKREEWGQRKTREAGLERGGAASKRAGMGQDRYALASMVLPLLNFEYGGGSGKNEGEFEKRRFWAAQFEFVYCRFFSKLEFGGLCFGELMLSNFTSVYNRMHQRPRKELRAH
jgi:hypothetical protein